MKRILASLLCLMAFAVQAQETTENPLKGKIINVIGDSYVKSCRLRGRRRGGVAMSVFVVNVPSNL